MTGSELSAKAMLSGWLESIRTSGGAPSLICFALFAARLVRTNRPYSTSLRISGDGNIESLAIVRDLIGYLSGLWA